MLRCFKCAPWLIQDQTHTLTYTWVHTLTLHCTKSCMFLYYCNINSICDVITQRWFCSPPVKHTGTGGLAGGGGGGRVAQRWSTTLPGSLERATGGGCTLSSVPPNSLSSLWVSFGSFCRWYKQMQEEPGCLIVT